MTPQRPKHAVMTMATTNVENDSRQGLTADSWWTVDRSHVPPLKVGATPLVELCIRVHGWSEHFALRVLDGYRDFLSLKHFFGDFDAKKLSPSIPIDQMWHQHILDTANYSKDCQLLFGKVIHHNPYGSLDEEGRERRIEQTVAAVRLKFGEDYDRQVWNFGVTAMDRDERERRMRSDRAACRGIRQSETDERSHHSASTNGTVSDGSEESTVATPKITIRIRDQTGEETFFCIKPTTRMQKVRETYAARKGVRPKDLRLLLDANLIFDYDTPLSLELDDQDQIDCMLDQIGC